MLMASFPMKPVTTKMRRMKAMVCSMPFSCVSSDTLVPEIPVIHQEDDEPEMMSDEEE
jgi:hypothetical protein